MPTPENVSLDHLQQIVDALAVSLGHSVAVDDVQGRLVVSSRHFGDEDPLRVYAVIHRASDERILEHFRSVGIYAWTSPGRVPGNAALEFKPRVCCPVRHEGVLYGHLFLIDDGITDAQVRSAARAAESIATAMAARLTVREDARRRSAQLVRELVTQDPDSDAAAQARARIADHVPGDARTAVALVVAIANAEGPDFGRTALRGTVESLARGRRFENLLTWVRPGSAVLLLPGRATVGARELAESLVGALSSPRGAAVAGIGSSRPLTEVATSFREGELCVRAAHALPAVGPVVEVSELGATRLLLELPPRLQTWERLPAGVRRLAEHADGANLLETLETYLEHAGSAAETAAALHVHRSTLHYRLGRIQEVAGVDLSDGGQRLDLHLGVRMLHILRS